jgi:hypothetical protein
LQGTPGAIAVLHANTRRLDFHPHVHLVMPAAAISFRRTPRRSQAESLNMGWSLWYSLPDTVSAISSRLRRPHWSMPGQYPRAASSTERVRL